MVFEEGDPRAAAEKLHNAFNNRGHRRRREREMKTYAAPPPLHPPPHKTHLFLFSRKHEDNLGHKIHTSRTIERTSCSCVRYATP